MWYVIPTSLVGVFFGTAFPTSSFNFIEFSFILVDIVLRGVARILSKGVLEDAREACVQII